MSIVSSKLGPFEPSAQFLTFFVAFGFVADHFIRRMKSVLCWTSTPILSPISFINLMRAAFSSSGFATGVCERTNVWR